MVAPLEVNVITPPQLHVHIEASVNAGMPAIMVVAAPGVHGADVAGTHGIGVSTPSAAEVAAATVGLASDVHIPNGGMFTNGLESAMLAIGMYEPLTRFAGANTSDAGAAPNEHCICEPMFTIWGMCVHSRGTTRLTQVRG